MRKTIAHVLFLVAAVPYAAATQAFNVDDVFTASANNTIRTTTIQADGKTLIGGDFTNINGIGLSRLARLNADGSLDTSFNAVVNRSVRTIATYADGKVLIGGAFTLVNGESHRGIARLNADGSLDSSFNAGTGTNGVVGALAIQIDGKIIVGGSFSKINDVSATRVVRLNDDGSIDTAFDSGSINSGSVLAIALQSDGKVIIGGSFTRVGGVSRNRIARINTDGSLDTSFNPGSGADSVVRDVALQLDGKLIVVGDFAVLADVVSGRIARLNTNGSIDVGFNASAEATVSKVTLQADGKVLVNGGFNAVNGLSRSKIARLDINGSLDSSFNPGAGANGTIFAVAIQANNKVLIVGSFTNVDGAVNRRIALINSDGSLDVAFNPGAGADGTVYAMAVQPDYKVLIGGNFANVNGTTRARIARLNRDGSVDTTFDAGSASGSGFLINEIYAVSVQPDGKVLIGGDFTGISGTARNNIARLNSDGSLDTAFDPGLGANNHIRAIALQPDGGVVIGGDFTTVNGITHNRIARLDNDGSLDTTFSSGAGANGTVIAVVVMSSGKLLLGGQFTSVDNTARNHIAQLDADGSLDITFDPGTGADLPVGAVTVQTDGKILIGGSFASVDGTSRIRMARLNANGTVDTTFDPGNQFDPDNVASEDIVRLEADGSQDTTFVSGAGPNDNVWTVAVQSDGKLLIAGDFTSVSGTTRNRSARISIAEAAMQSLKLATSGQSIDWQRSGAGPVFNWTTLEMSNDGENWAPLGNGQRVLGGWRFDGLSLPVESNFYVRARGYYGTSGFGTNGSLSESVAQLYLPQAMTCSDAPASLSPLGTIGDPRPVYTWSGYSDCTWYRIWIRDEAGNNVSQTWHTSPFSSCDTDTDCEVQPDTALGNGNYTWQVQGYNETTLHSPWSAPRSFSVALPTGGCTSVPVLRMPIDTTEGARPAFSWDGLPSCSWYLLTVNNSAGANIHKTWYTAAQTNCAGDTSCTVTPTTVLGGGNYTWYVEGWNSSTLLSPKSTTANFQVGSSGGGCTSAPQSLTPSSTISEARPTFKWNGYANCTWYQVLINDASGVQISKTWHTAPHANCGSDTSCEATPLISLANGNYSWSVQGWNESTLHSPWTTPRNFIVAP